MKIIETHVTPTTIHMWLANDPELHNATDWQEVELPIHSLVLAEGRHALGDLRRAVLRTIRDAIDNELDRLGTPDTGGRSRHKLSNG